ncbi:hypothetical protein [Lutibacter citreus]|uniref:hypothetical protein n=1 Tax=Lutibacter citreus TaxID=2138210 RepID=UPI000DBE510C|nr:hypothetical protein [Lutibacter citreus]
MTKYFYILIISTILITSCSTTRNIESEVWDEKFQLCKDLELSESINNSFYPIPESKIDSVKNIYSLFENFLLDEKILNEITKKGYKDLLQKSFDKKITSKKIFEFSEFMRFDTSMIFMTFSNKGCFANTEYRYNQLSKEKKGWQYEFCVILDKYEADGGFNKKGLEILNKSIDKIPNRKFNKEVYRRYFLDLVYAVGQQN